MTGIEPATCALRILFLVFVSLCVKKHRVENKLHFTGVADDVIRFDYVFSRANL